MIETTEHAIALRKILNENCKAMSNYAKDITNLRIRNVGLEKRIAELEKEAEKNPTHIGE